MQVRGQSEPGRDRRIVINLAALDVVNGIQECESVLKITVQAVVDEFGGNRPDTPSTSMNSPSILQTVLRTYAVQSYNMSAVGVAPADVTIAPDVRCFDMSEFTSATELAAVGAPHAVERLPTIKALLQRLDKRLFAFD